MATLMTWFVPAPGAERDLLITTIGTLAAACAAPTFPPHVTIVPMYDSDTAAALRTLRSLTDGLRPFDVTFGAFGQEQTYFRSLYLRAESSQLLTTAHEAGLRAWALQDLPYMPHLSLLYCDLAPEQKKPLQAAIGIALPLTVRFDAAELWIHDRHGVSAWRPAARVPLDG
jgi:2'-5' RNA ligase